MRNLTIKRTKSFVGCAMKLKAYLEDDRGDTTIDGTLCRLLGTLKNGEEKTFPIDERAARVYVIVDQVSKSFCRDCFAIPEGQDDVVLSGRNRFDLSTGNAFRFDNNEGAMSGESRRRGSRIGLFVLIFSLLVGGAVGWYFGRALTAPKEKSFTAEGMTIVLTDAFKEADYENYTASYVSNDAAVLVTKDPFTLFDAGGDLTLGEYRSALIQASGVDPVERTVIEGIPAIRYERTNPETGVVYRYTGFFYKSDDAYWLIQFATVAGKSKVDDAQIAQWAKSVSFGG